MRSSNNESNHIAAAAVAELCMLLRLCLLLSFLFLLLLLSFCLLFHMTGKFVMLFMLLSSHAVDCQLFVAVVAAVAFVSVDFFLRASCLNSMNVVGNE